MFQFQFGVTGPGNLKTPGFHFTKIAHKHSATLEPTVLLLNWFSHEQDLAKILQQDVQGNYLQLSVQRADTCRSCRSQAMQAMQAVPQVFVLEGSATVGPEAQPGRAGRNVFEHAVGRSPWATLDG